MEKIWQLNQIEKISRRKKLPMMLTERIRLAVQTMNEAYGKTRNPDTDLGGLVLVVDSPGEWLKISGEIQDREPATGIHRGSRE